MGLLFERSVRNASSRFICLLSAGCCLLFVGCNNGKQLQADLYQRELRLQEDEIYRLEDNLEEYQAIVRGYRCEVADLKHELANTPSRPVNGSAHSTPLLSPIEGPGFAPNHSAPPKPSPDPEEQNSKPYPAPEAAEAPPYVPSADTSELQSGRVATLADHKTPLLQEEEVEEQAPPLKKLNADATTKKKLALLDDAEPPLPFPAIRALPIAESTVEPLPLETAPNETTPNRRIATFVEPGILKATPKEEATPLLKLATVDSVRVNLENGSPETTGEATLLTKLSPFAGGEAAYFEGEASILLADMSRRGTRRRIGRWDFSTDEVAQSWADGSTQLELPLLLPDELINKTPTNRPLRLWVRLVDTRGRKTLQSIDIDFLDHPWRLAETRPIKSNQARPIEMASLPLRRIPIDNGKLSEEPKQERVAQTNEEGWHRAVLHRSNARSTSKRDDNVRPVTHTYPAPSLR